MKRVYLSGPMSNYPDYNYPAFHAAAAKWRAKGFEVENPAEHFNGDQGLPKSQYMRSDIMALLNVEAVIVLPGWEQSEGASLEVAIANALALPVFDATRPGEYVAAGGSPSYVKGLYGLPTIDHHEAGAKEPVADKVAFSISAGYDPATPGEAATIIRRVTKEQSRGTAAALEERLRHEIFDKGYDPADYQIEYHGDVLGSPRITRKEVKDFSGIVDGGGYKGSMDDPGKVLLDLIPPAFIRAVGEVLTHGAHKYASGNWMRGMSWSHVYGATLRHLLAWHEGEDTDPASGLSHLSHAACNLAFLIHFASQERYEQFDDRVFRNPSGSDTEFRHA